MNKTGVEVLLDDIANLKQGNKEMALFYEPDCVPNWEFHLGNTSQTVNLGEVAGEFEVWGYTLSEVIMKMRTKLIGDK